MAELQIISDEELGLADPITKRGRVRRVHFKMIGVQGTLQPVTPEFEGDLYNGFTLTIKNLNAPSGDAPSAMDLYYGLPGEDLTHGPIDDSKDHWEKETGFAILPAGATRYCHFSHTPPAAFIIKATVTSPKVVDFEGIIDLELR